MTRPRLQDEIKQSRPFDQPEAEAILNVARTQEVLRAPLDALMKSHGLSGSSYNVLRILRGAGAQGLPCREIGERMVTRVPDVTRLLDRLEGAGLVTRRRDTQDRRVVLTRITKDGLERLQALDGPMQGLQKQLLGHMDRNELETLSRLLEAARHRDA
jgi:DNA-binding MarR family transcriptional regulator